MRGLSHGNSSSRLGLWISFANSIERTQQRDAGKWNEAHHQRARFTRAAPPTWAYQQTRVVTGVAAACVWRRREANEQSGAVWKFRHELNKSFAAVRRADPSRAPCNPFATAFLAVAHSCGTSCLAYPESLRSRPFIWPSGQWKMPAVNDSQTETDGFCWPDWWITNVANAECLTAAYYWVRYVRAC